MIFPLLKEIDHIASGIIHKHESLLLTVLLFPAGVMFYPQLIALPTLFLYVNFGSATTIQYFTCVLVGLAASSYLKRKLNRPRPPVIANLNMKPMFLRKGQTNMSMPSGDSLQAGVFFYWYMSQTNNDHSEFVKLAIAMTMFNVALARVYFCCHYFSDTIVGFMMGTSISYILNSLDVI